MSLYSYDLGLDLDQLRRETAQVTEGWRWERGAYGHALSLPRYRDLHPFQRFAYQNFPCTGFLDRAPALRRIFDGFECDKVSFRLLRRGPSSAYHWHTDGWKGPGVVRFQVPIVSDGSAYLITTDYTESSEIRGGNEGPLNEKSFPAFAAANAGHFEKHFLAAGRLHHFDTNRVHTLVNPGPGERITLSLDLVANDWLCERFPAVREELGPGPLVPLPRPGALRLSLARTAVVIHLVRNLLRGRRSGGRDQAS